jgi:hypothetical protein
MPKCRSPDGAQRNPGEMIRERPCTWPLEQRTRETESECLTQLGKTSDHNATAHSVCTTSPRAGPEVSSEHPMSIGETGKKVAEV